MCGNAWAISTPNEVCSGFTIFVYPRVPSIHSPRGLWFFPGSCTNLLHQKGWHCRANVPSMSSMSSWDELRYLHKLETLASFYPKSPSVVATWLRILWGWGFGMWPTWGHQNSEWALGFVRATVPIQPWQVTNFVDGSHNCVSAHSQFAFCCISECTRSLAASLPSRFLAPRSPCVMNCYAGISEAYFAPMRRKCRCRAAASWSSSMIFTCQKHLKTDISRSFAILFPWKRVDCLSGVSEFH